MPDRDLDALRRAARSWLASNLPAPPDFPVPSVMTVSDQAQLDYLRAWQQRVYDAGFVGVEWPEAYGGRGLPRGSQRVIDQELGQARAPALLNLVGLNWAGPIILRHGTEDQKARYLPLFAGEQFHAHRHLVAPTEG